MRGGEWVLLCSAVLLAAFVESSDVHSGIESSRSFIDVEGGPDSVVWVVQLSDLHFSVFHPSRATDFRQLVGPVLAMIKPSLVLITGDLTDGKSKDLLTSKQNEQEWIEYEEVLTEVIKKSGLDEKIFYDLRGNHDNFGVSEIEGKHDFYQKYSVNGRLGRRGNVHSVTLHKNGTRHLFVGLDSTMEIGPRGPTNLFGHPTDHLLEAVDFELAQFDSSSPVIKIAFGHFPLSFSAVSESGRSLKEVFLKHSLAAYLCGHLHARFGKNLKRRHLSHPRFLGEYFQLNICEDSPRVNSRERNCSADSKPTEEFWEWEMGDWRRRRKMRILAVDSGFVSFLDVDLTEESAKTFILPTYPVDSRFMQRSDICRSSGSSSTYERVRALVFSARKIRAVHLKIYDSKAGKNLSVALNSEMKKEEDRSSRGDLYTAQWNREAFNDPSPVRYWLQIEAVDFSGRSSFSELRPFSVNGLTARVDWKWKEFLVMGIQWGSLYRPLLSLTLFSLFSLLLVPPGFLLCVKDRYTYARIVRGFSERKHCVIVLQGFIWAFSELSRERMIWFGTLVYLFHVTFFPWFSGHIFNDHGHLVRMTHRGWDMGISKKSMAKEYIGSPDVMIIVLPHLCFIIMPSILLMAALAAEKSAYRAYFLSLSGKKCDDDDEDEDDDNSIMKRNGWKRLFWERRMMRKFLLLLCLTVLWDHGKRCRSLVRAYEMNPLVDSFAYSFTIPLLLATAAYRTS